MSGATSAGATTFAADASQAAILCSRKRTIRAPPAGRCTAHAPAVCTPAHHNRSPRRRWRRTACSSTSSAPAAERSRSPCPGAFRSSWRSLGSCSSPSRSSTRSAAAAAAAAAVPAAAATGWRKGAFVSASRAGSHGRARARSVSWGGRQADSWDADTRLRRPRDSKVTTAADPQATTACLQRTSTTRNRNRTTERNHRTNH